MGAAQAMKRIPRIKFPQRHSKPSSGSSSSQPQAASSTASSTPKTFFSTSTTNAAAVGGKASLQPKRTPVSNEEIEAILLGGCI